MPYAPRAMVKPVNLSEIRLTDSLSGKRILLTGTTGFLGKVVLSMLLARFPEIGRIYALIRPGINDRAVDRFRRQVMPSPAMAPLKDRHGDELEAFLDEKVMPVDGNIVKAGCGIPDETMALLEKEGVDLIINSAGLVDFDPPIDSALGINALGARNVVALAHRLDASLLHVSTCFVAGQTSRQILEDEPILNQLPDNDVVRSAEFDHRDEISRLQELAAQVRSRAEDPAQKAKWRREARERLEREGRDPEDPSVLKGAMLRLRKAWISTELKRVGMERSTFWGWTNTYTFTKSLGEMVIAEAAEDGLNACIVRPAIVESAVEFPLEGWNEGMTTTAPLILLTRQGVPHLPYDEDIVLDIIPVDMVAAVIIAAAGALFAGAHKFVYHASSGDLNPLTVRGAVELTGFGTKRYARRKARSGFSQLLLRHNETEPVQPKAYKRRSVPRFKTLASKTLKAVDALGPDRFAWIRQPASFVRDVAQEVERSSRRAETILDLFLPFTAEHAPIFRADNTRHLMSRIIEEDRAKLPYAPGDIVWRDYWCGTHTEGLEKWVFPKLEAEMAEAPKQAYVHRNLNELFETSTHVHRHRIALRYLRKSGEEHLTYGELRSLAQRVAGYLVAHGVKREDRVLLICENRPEWAACYFGILLAGGTVVPMDAAAKVEEIQNVRAASEAHGLLLSPRQSRRLMSEGARLETLSDACAGLWLMPEALNHDKPLTRSVEAARLASVIFTSGTTGKPKGVMLTHRNFTFEVSRLLGVFNLSTDDHLLSVLPLHHTFEFTAGLLTPLARGARITYISQLNADFLNRALKAGVSALIGVPALWQLLERRIETQIEDAGAMAELVMKGVRSTNSFLREYFGLNAGPVVAYPVHRALGGRLKYLVSGGSALNSEVAEFFHSLGFNLTEGYGLTETAPVLTVTHPSNKLKAGSVGKPLHGVEIRIDEPNVDGIGEVLARGPNVMAGYYRDEDATQEVMDDGWLRTGDLGRLDEDGRLYLAGRQKDVIVDADGRNVYPDEVEEIYSQSSLIKEISVVGLVQDGGAERVAALVVPEFESAKTHEQRESIREAVHEHLREMGEKLPYYKRIKIVHLWDGVLPRTATRKIRRPQVLRIIERLNAAKQKQRKGVSVSSGKGALKTVCRVVAQVSGKAQEDLKSETRFVADLGFDSLMFVELAGALENHVRTDITSEQLMTIETLGDLIPLLRTKDTSDEAPAPSARVAGSGVSRDAVEEDSLTIPAPVAGVGKRLLSWGQRAFYDKVMDVEVRGRAYIPCHSGFLVAANHASHLDAGLIKTALGDYGDNLVSLAAKDYFFGSKVRRAYFENFTNLLPIERHGNVKQSLKLALRTLEEGSTLLIFPEGTRSPTGTMQPFKPSLGYLMTASGVPVLPMYLWGTYEAMPKGSTLMPSKRRIGAIMGPPIEASVVRSLAAGRSKSVAYRLLTYLVESAVRALRDEGGYIVDDLVAHVRTLFDEQEDDAFQQRTSTTDKPVGARTDVGSRGEQPVVKENGRSVSTAASRSTSKNASSNGASSGKTSKKRRSKKRTRRNREARP